MVGPEAAAGAPVWLGAAIFLTVIAACQAGILQGYRMVGALARARIYGAVLGSISASLLVYFYREDGILPALVAIPLSLTLLGFHFLGKVSPPALTSTRDVAREWRPLLTLGLVLMSVALLSGGIQILVRAMAVRELGLEAAGLYHAAWTASSSNVGLVLAALASDYFPSLSSVAHDRTATTKLVNQQLRVALLVSAPFLVALAAAAPIALQLLYSSEFTAASSLLRWHVAGDTVKVAAWCLAFVLPATNSKKLFIAVEIFFSIAFVALSAVLLPIAGLEGLGIAHLTAYGLYLAVLVPLVICRFGVVLSWSNCALFALVLSLVLGVLAVAHYSSTLALLGGLTMAVGFTLYSFVRLNELGGDPLSAFMARLKTRSST
jgi:PST family polysaccharide transporter